MTNHAYDAQGPLPRGRQAGVGLHITSLPGQYGVGEIGDAAFRFTDAMGKMNLRVWQFLPTGPTGFGDSPYQPLSAFAGNEMLVDITALARMGLLTSNEVDTLAGLPSQAVDYGKLIPAKNALLELAASRFHSKSNTDLKSGFDRFLDEHDQRWLHDYAMFRVLKTRHGERPWQEWTAPFRHRRAAALRVLEAEAARQIENIKIIQFLFLHQWRQLRAFASDRGIRLFGDMPMYVALDSADAWASREILRLNRNGRPKMVAGVPPDYFSANGQLWGNPLYDWDKIAADGYRWWTDRLRHALAMADVVRIDHFRGFEAYWAVPARNVTARSGEWQPGPGHSIFDAMQNALGRLPLVAEDLGVITAEVEALRDRYHLPGMKVLQFELARQDFDVAAIPACCVCYTGTHDNDTTVGWFHASPTDRREVKEVLRMQKTVLEITNGRPDTIHRDLTGLAYSSPARLAIVPMQDYLGLGSQARLNTPGTSANNWRWRMRFEQLPPALLDSIGEMVVAAGRTPSDS